MESHDQLTKSQIKKAGETLRRQLRDRSIVEVELDPANVHAWNVVRLFEFGCTIDVPSRTMTHFLLTYDRYTQHADVEAFADGLEAFDAFSIRERELMGDDRFEVVMLAAEQEADLHVTHANFFTKGDMLPS